MANEKEGKKSKFKMRYWLKDIEAKHNLKNTAIKSGAQVAVGVIGGAVGTAILGKWSFLPGLGLIGLGNYKDYSWMAPMGIGMAASSLTLVAEDALQGVDGFDLKTEASNAKKRLVTLKDTLLKRMYVDRFFKKKNAEKGGGNAGRKTAEDTSEEINGLESPSTELEEVEKQLIASAMEFQKKQQARQVNGVDPDLMGLEAEVDFSTM